MNMLGSLKSFAAAEKASDDFEMLLRTLGVTIKTGGALEALHLVLKELADWHAGKCACQPPTSWECWTDARVPTGAMCQIATGWLTPSVA